MWRGRGGEREGGEEREDGEGRGGEGRGGEGKGGEGRGGMTVIHIVIGMFTSYPIGLYRDVWIAAIARSRTRVTTLESCLP